MQNEAVNIWNIKFNLMSIDEIASCIDDWMTQGRKGIHITGVDYNVVVLAQNNDFLRKAIIDSDIVNVDSFLPAIYLKKAGYGDGQRVPTPDVFEALLRQAEISGRTVFFLGATADTLVKLQNAVEKEFPNLNVVGVHDGYFDDKEEAQIIKNLANLAPDYLFIGMPSPRKEQFILKYKHTLPIGCFYGVGGAFDAMAGVLGRPPKWLQGHGMEGLLRMLRNPVIYGKRVSSYMKFFKLVNQK